MSGFGNYEKPKRDYTRAVAHIIDALEEKEMSRVKLANSVGVTPRYLQNWLLGKSNPPSEETVSKIATVLGIDPDVLVVESGIIPRWMQAAVLGSGDIPALRRYLQREIAEAI